MRSSGLSVAKPASQGPGQTLQTASFVSDITELFAHAAFRACASSHMRDILVFAVTGVVGGHRGP